jgi:CO/xanthine dehydrogenase FAD-binding subunit
LTAAGSPRSLDDALGRLAADPGLVPIAGCTDLLVAPPLARAAMERVLDLTRIAELQGFEPTAGGGLAIGAATPFTAIRHQPAVRERYPALAAAAAVIGGWQIQNRATLGGNAANASPAGDSLPVLLALDATLDCAGPQGRREIPYRDFHTGYRQTALRPGELIVRVLLPPRQAGGRQGCRKVGTRAALAISTVVVAAAARIEGGRFAELRLAAGSVAPVPVRRAAAEAAAVGEPADAATAERVAAAAAAEVEPIDDVRSTAEYRSWVLGRVVRRLLLELAG